MKEMFLKWIYHKNFSFWSSHYKFLGNFDMMGNSDAENKAEKFTFKKIIIENLFFHSPSFSMCPTNKRDMTADSI